MNREVHVRICESRGVKFPPATRRLGVAQSMGAVGRREPPAPTMYGVRRHRGARPIIPALDEGDIQQLIPQIRPGPGTTTTTSINSVWPSGRWRAARGRAGGGVASPAGVALRRCTRRPWSLTNQVLAGAQMRSAGDRDDLRPVHCDQCEPLAHAPAA